MKWEEGNQYGREDVKIDEIGFSLEVHVGF